MLVDPDVAKDCQEIFRGPSVIGRTTDVLKRTRGRYLLRLVPRLLQNTRNDYLLLLHDNNGADDLKRETCKHARFYFVLFHILSQFIEDLNTTMHTRCFPGR